MRSRMLLLVSIVSLNVIVAVSGSLRSFAVEQPTGVPAWLQTHVGEGEGQIAQVVLQRARALYLKKVSEGAVKNPCYFAMDATRPGGFARRFYVICEDDRSFRAIPTGHGNGRNLQGIANFANGIECAKNFGNAMDSKLTTGGPYVTAETITSFKGYYRDVAGNTWLSAARSCSSTAKAKPQMQDPAPSAGIRLQCLEEHACERMPTALMRIPMVTFCSESWWITRVAASMAAPVGRARTPSKSSR